MDDKRYAFMFAGQGSQFVGMGKDLYEKYASARETFAQANQVLGYDLATVCFDGPQEKLTQSAFCQPAIFTMSLACLAVLRRETAITPAVCAGLSLGEFAALTAAEGISFPDALRLVSVRGQLMDEACRHTEGGMAAVLNADRETVESTCAAYDIDTANFNCPGQIVVSGEVHQLEKALAALKEKGVKRIIKLDVDGAFHSRLMRQAADNFGPYLDNTAIRSPRIPFLQNVTGAQAEDPEQIKQNLKQQICNSVKWESCIRTMRRDFNADSFIEIGPGNTLQGFMRKIDKSLPAHSVGNNDDVTQLKEVL